MVARYTTSIYPEHVDCRWCGKSTSMLGTRLCDACWELERRMRRDPVLAKRVLDEIMEEERGNVLS